MMDALSHYLAVSTVEALRIILPGICYDVAGSGDILTYGGFSMRFADVCSGIRTFSVLLPLTVLCLVMDFKSLRRSFLLLAFPTMAFVAWSGNVLRCLLIFLVSTLDSSFGLGVFHDYVGYFIWMLEIIVLITYFSAGHIQYNQNKTDGHKT